MKKTNDVKSSSRREFLKTTSAAAVATTLMSWNNLPGAYAAGSDEIRIGLIGCGGRGTGAALQALRADKGTVLTAMGDIFSDRLNSSLEGLTKEYDCALVISRRAAEAAGLDLSGQHQLHAVAVKGKVQKVEFYALDTVPEV